MKVAIRVDVADHIGIGHAMRCMTLANALYERGATITFIGRFIDESTIRRIHTDGHNHYELPAATQAIQLLPDDSNNPSHAGWLGKSWQDDLSQTANTLKNETIDWLIIDHYSLDARWENAARAFCDNIMVIDDLADRSHDCDLLLDQTLARNTLSYQHLVPPECTILTGSKYVMLRPQFAAWRDRSLVRRQSCKLEHLLITMGGVDKDNVTAQVLDAVNKSTLPETCHITIVMNAASRFLADIRHQASSLAQPVNVLVNVSNMAELMANSDLCIGTAGMTSWERCCLGLPTLMLIVAKNQLDTAQSLQKIGAVKLLNQVSDIKEQINMLNKSSNTMQTMSQVACKITDGTGLNNVISHLELNHA